MSLAGKLLSRTPVVILAGGLGTRLRPVVPDLPKGLAPIGDEPFLQIQIGLLRDQGAREFVLCVGHLADTIRHQFGDGGRWGVRIRYSVESKRLLGTAGALKRAERLFKPRALVLNGDTYLAADYERLLRHHEQASALATLSLARAPDGGRFGTVLLDAQGRYLTGFKEKENPTNGAAHWLNAGAYVIDSSLLDAVRPDAVASLERDVLPNAIANGQKIAAFPCNESFYDIGTPDDLATFIDFYKGLKNGPRQRAG